MLVTVVIPTYRPKDYLWKTLDSLKAQTLSVDDFEVIIVLNGDVAPYDAKIRDFIEAAHFSFRIQLLTTPTPGVSNARNLAIDTARGTYLTFLDDDDWVSPSFLSDLLAQADESTIVEANVQNFNEADGSYADDYLTRAYRRCESLQRITLFNGRSLLSSSCCKLIPRAVIGKDRYCTAVTHGEDALFMATISPRIGRISLSVPEAVYFRRVHGASAQYRRRPIAARLRNTSRLTLRYLVLLLQPWRYNFPFILTRIAATLKRCM